MSTAEAPQREHGPQATAPSDAGPPASDGPPQGEPPRGLIARRTVGEWFLAAAIALGTVTAICIALGIVAIDRLSDARTLAVDRNGPALTASLELASALANQETAVRGYALTGDPAFLAPYRRGRAQASAALRELRGLTTVDELATVRRDLDDVVAAAAAWEADYARPAIAAVARAGPDAADRPPRRLGDARFAAVRAALDRQREHMLAARDAGRDRLASASRFLIAAFVVIAVLLVAGLVGVLVALRTFVSAPLRGVGRRVRRAARGDFEQRIVGKGARDVVQLAEDVDVMRRRIVDELVVIRRAHEQLDEQARELQRSNAELEQFAYVASHDLQEPLRKVASFCQLLERRYGDALDERGRQYVAFAVDGAKRMQQLINDLLAFSRVGRGPDEREPVAIDAVVRQALTSLATAIEESGARIVVGGPLPRVRGEVSLLAAVFQNLIGNALKFHGDAPPRIEIDVARRGPDWEFSVTDNGIGIEPAYAERIFMVFQRLHPKEQYAGTGIGLAMCRKIVEYHGGSIWLDTESTEGTTFRFTLPALEEDG